MPNFLNYGVTEKKGRKTEISWREGEIRNERKKMNGKQRRNSASMNHNEREWNGMKMVGDALYTQRPTESIPEN